MSVSWTERALVRTHMYSKRTVSVGRDLIVRSRTLESAELQSRYCSNNRKDKFINSVSLGWSLPALIYCVCR